MIFKGMTCNAGITSLKISDMARALRAGEFTSRELTRAYMDRISATDSGIGAFITQTFDEALRTADEADALLASDPDSAPPLCGIPCALKDNIVTRGVRTTCASRMLSEYVPPYDAHVVELLKACRAPMLGKLNMDEFAMGSSSESSAMRPVRNPRDRARVPGGSSGGSAAAIAARQAAFTLGSDTGGSIRQPAAFCGAVGMKPTYGAVSRYGLIAFASSLDQIGPLTADVESNALVLSAISGRDARDATCTGLCDFAREMSGDARGLRVALPREFLAEGIAPDVRRGVLAAADALRAQGARVDMVDMSLLEYALPAYYVISSAEASSNLARFDGVKYGYRASGCDSLKELYLRSRTYGLGAEVKRRIMLGTFALSSGYYDAYYKKALQVRTLISRAYDDIFASHDIMLSPTAPTTAYLLGEKASSLDMYMGDIYTVPVNIAGLPALSMPCGRDAQGLPVGVQLIGPRYSEGRIYSAALALENALGTYDTMAAQGGDAI